MVIAVGAVGVEEFGFFAPRRLDVSFAGAHGKSECEQGGLSCHERYVPVRSLNTLKTNGVKGGFLSRVNAVKIFKKRNRGRGVRSGPETSG